MVAYSINMESALPTPAQVFRAVPCFCGRLLVAARATTRLYNDELRRAGIETTQFSVLQLLSRLGPMTQNQLGQRMAAGKTTVSRNLKLLEKHGWISVEEGKDRRSRIVSLTLEGKAQLKKSQSHWMRAQERIQVAIPKSQLEAFSDLLPLVTEAVLAA